MMPEINGYQLCATLKADATTKDIPVLFISALSDTHDKIKGFTTGAVDFITKPFQAEEVLSRVKTHLALSKMRTTLQQQNALLEKEIQERLRAEKALEEANRQLEKLATHDKLTGIANRRKFDQVIATEWEPHATGR